MHLHRVVAPLRDFGRPLIDLISEMPYPPLQSMLDPSVPSGEPIYEKACVLRELSDDAIETFVARAERLPSPGTTMFPQPLGGAIGDAGEASTPFRNRHAQFIAIAMAHWTRGTERDTKNAWALSFVEELTPNALRGVYVNFDRDDTDNRVHSTHGPNYNRLRGLKAKHDPTNLFRLNQNIKSEAAQANLAPAAVGS